MQCIAIACQSLIASYFSYTITHTPQTNTEEGKIIVYTTSIRTVRKTYDDCKYVLGVFHNLRVRIEERDIYINEFHHRELEERLDLKNVLKLPVPQIYINGQHVGVKLHIYMHILNGVHYCMPHIGRFSCPMACVKI